MRLLPGLWILPFVLAVWSAAQSSSKSENPVIQAAKNVRVSTLDGSLPNVALEFFLKSESDGSPIHWQEQDCGKQNGNGALKTEQDSTTCVAGEVSFKDLRSVTVLLAIGPSDARGRRTAALLSVTITDQSGMIRPVHHLSDLPMELHRSAPRPRDISDRATPGAL